MSHLVGDRIQPSAVFDADQVTVSAVVRAPDGTQTSYSGAGVHQDDVGVYHVDFVATLAGEHEWAFTGDTETLEGRFSVEESLVDDPPDELLDGALCALSDIASRVPGYEPGDDRELDHVLEELILQESGDFIEVTGREIIPMNDDTVRIYDILSSIIARRQLPIGDVAAVTQVELFDYDGTTSLGVIDPGLYVLTPRTRPTWGPYTRLVFPPRPNSGPVLLAPGRSLRITGTFGFRQIPVTVTRSVAVFAIFRYLNDVAPSGTALGDLANNVDVNLAASLRAAIETRDRFSTGPFA